VRSYGEAIEVRTAPPSEGTVLPTGSVSAAPSQFLWRGRVYVVREVLAHWVELGAWWTTRALQPAPPRPHRTLGHPALTSGTGIPVSTVGTEGADGTAGRWSGGARSVAAEVGAVEREVWRVEAAPGRSTAPGVYDLVHDIHAHDIHAHDIHAHDGHPLGRHAPPPGPGPTGPGATPLPGPGAGTARWRLARALD
jgi:hypothetical protein